MRRMRKLGIVIGAAALCAAAAFAVRSSFAGAYGGSIYSFPHEPHISPAVVSAALAESAAALQTGKRTGGGGTVDRECRVCHDYDKGDDAHLDGCYTLCHVDNKHLVQQAEPKVAKKGPVFPHKEHLKDKSITCFSCHGVRKEMGWIEFTNPAGGLGDLGVAGRPGGKGQSAGTWTCNDCHHTHEPKNADIPQFAKTGDGKACSECHLDAEKIEPKKLRGASAAAAPGATFRHGDHGGSAGPCLECHAEMKTSKSIWDSDPVKGTTDACTRCHVGEGGKSLAVPSGKTTQLEFVRFSKFPHADHISAPEGKIQTSGKVDLSKGEGGACATCHYPEQSAESAKYFPNRKPSREPVSREELIEYSACLPCHADWRTEGHGVGDWACFRCHTSDAPDASGKLPMAQSAVKRETLSKGVQFAEMHHPGITSQGAALKDRTQPSANGVRECSDCHKGDVETLPARVRGKPFTHASHLTGDPVKDDAMCASCHSSSLVSTHSRSLRRFDPHLEPPASAAGAAGAAPGCLTCHVGAKAEDLGLQITNRIVPEFTHKGHVTAKPDKGFAGLRCSECHAAIAEAPGYTTAKDVLDCTKCHTHGNGADKDPAKIKRTGPSTSSKESAKFCVACHEDVQSTTPPNYETERRHMTLVAGAKQFHDEGGACADCHARENLPYTYEQRIKKAEIKLSIHADQALSGAWFNNPALPMQSDDPQANACMKCHRKEPRNHLRGLNK